MQHVRTQSSLQGAHEEVCCWRIVAIAVPGEMTDMVNEQDGAI